MHSFVKSFVKSYGKVVRHAMYRIETHSTTEYAMNELRGPMSGNETDRASKRVRCN